MKRPALRLPGRVRGAFEGRQESVAARRNDQDIVGLADPAGSETTTFAARSIATTRSPLCNLTPFSAYQAGVLIKMSSSDLLPFKMPDNMMRL